MTSSPSFSSKSSLKSSVVQLSSSLQLRAISLYPRLLVSPYILPNILPNPNGCIFINDYTIKGEKRK